MNENNMIHVIDYLDVPNIVKLSGTCLYFYDLIKTDPIIKNILTDKINIILMDQLYFDNPFYNNTDIFTDNSIFSDDDNSNNDSSNNDNGNNDNSNNDSKIDILKKIYDVKTKKYFLEKIHLTDLCSMKNDYIIKHVIDNAYDLNICSEHFIIGRRPYYPIHGICMYSSKRIIKYAINAGMDINLDNCGQPIRIICDRSADENMTDIVKLCVDKYPYIFSELSNINGPLFTLLINTSNIESVHILKYLYCKDKKIILWVSCSYLSCIFKLIPIKYKIMLFSIFIIFISFFIYIFKN
jgi:hypothetical protein